MPLFSLKAEKFLYFGAGAILAAILILFVPWAEFIRFREAPPEFLRLHWHGGWGGTGDIWIYPNDSYRVRHYDSHSGATTKDRSGKKPGLFKSVVALVDSQNAWKITTESLNAEVEDLTPKGLVIGVSDAKHTFLELRLKHRMLVADFYAADSFAKDLPNAHQLKAFSAIETAFFEVNALTEN